jgi:pyridoxine/pyridoxamine 5'-phosphate oxidase
MEIEELALFLGWTVEPCASFKSRTNINGQKGRKLAQKILKKFLFFWELQDSRIKMKGKMF